MTSYASDKWKATTSTINLNSNDRTSGTTNFDCGFSINYPYYQDDASQYEVSILNMAFPFSAYPINQYNNKVYISENGGATITVTLDTKAYTWVTLSNELATKLTAASGVGNVYSVGYNSNTYLYTVTAGGAALAFAFVDGVNNTYSELGCPPLDTPLTVIPFTCPINIAGTRYVDVISNWSGITYSTSTTASVLARIMVDVSFGYEVIYAPALPHKFIISATHIDNLFIQLRDDKGNPFLLPDNAPFSMVLQINKLK